MTKCQNLLNKINQIISPYLRKPTHRGSKLRKRRDRGKIQTVPVSNTTTFNNTHQNPISEEHNNLAHFCLINARSICKQTDVLIDYIIEHDLQFVALTETWLSDSNKHKKVIGDLKPDGFDFIHAPRPKRGGGRVGLIYNINIKCENFSVYESATFEFFICDLTFKGTCTPVKLVVVYRSKYNCKTNRSTVNMFLNDFSEYLSTILPTQNKLFVVGDFNFHVNIPDDTDTIKLQDLLETCNMTQFVKEPNHISGNTLDLVLTRTSDNLVHSIQVGCQFSDHFAVHCKLNLQKPGYAKNLVTYRKLKAINRIDFECDTGNSELITSPKPDLTGLINQYNETLQIYHPSLGHKEQ